MQVRATSGSQKVPEYTLFRLKSVSFRTFGRRGGMPKSQMDNVFLAHIAFPRFRENPELIPRVFQKSIGRQVSQMDCLFLAQTAFPTFPWGEQDVVQRA